MLAFRRRGRGAHERTWGELASAWLDGELSGPEADRLREHTAVCGACQTKLASYRRLDGQLQQLTGALAVPPAYAIFERAAGERGAPLGVRVPGKLALAASAAVVVVGGASTPQVRDSIGNAVQYVRQIAAPASSTSYAGDRGIFKAPRNSVIVRSVRQYSAFVVGPDGASPRGFAATPVSRGPIYALAGGTLLVPAATDGSAWMVVASDGSAEPFPIPSGMQIVDVTAAGDRILLRTPDGQGGFSTAAGATQVVGAHGTLVWADSGGADVYSLSPDGRFALSGEPNYLVKIPLDAAGAGPIPEQNRVPFSGQDVRRPQMSRDGTRVVFLGERLAGGSGVNLTYAVLDSGFGVPPYRQSMSAAEPPVFALSPDGRSLAVQAVDTGGARKLDVWSLQNSAGAPTTLPAFTGTTIRRLAWSLDGTKLLIGLERGGNGEAWLWSPRGGLTQVMPGTDAGSAAWLPDGRIVVTSDQGNPTGLVAVGPPARGQINDAVVPLIGSDGGSVAPVFGAHGSDVALLAPGSTAEVLAPKGLQPAPAFGDVSAWSWAPDHHRAVVVRGGEAYVWSDRTGLGAPLTAAASAAWSPVGDRIVVTDTGGAIQILDAKGNAIAQPPPMLRGASLQWAPDGRSLVGVVHGGDGDELVRWDFGSAEPRVLIQGARIGTLAWSPDGRSLAFLRSDGGAERAGLFVMPSRGGGPRHVADVAGNSASLLWQPDGSRLLYVDQASSGAPGRLHSVAPDRTDARTIGTLYATQLYPGPH